MLPRACCARCAGGSQRAARASFHERPHCRGIVPTLEDSAAKLLRAPQPRTETPVPGVGLFERDVAVPPGARDAHPVPRPREPDAAQRAVAALVQLDAEALHVRRREGCPAGHRDERRTLVCPARRLGREFALSAAPSRAFFFSVVLSSSFFLFFLRSRCRCAGRRGSPPAPPPALVARGRAPAPPRARLLSRIHSADVGKRARRARARACCTPAPPAYR